MIVLLLLLGTPVVLISGAFAERRRRPRLDVDVGRLRFRPRSGWPAWCMAWTGIGLLAALVSLFLSGALGWWGVAPLVLAALVLLQTLTASAGRFCPREIVLDPLHLHLDQRSVPLVHLRSVRLAGPGNPWNHRSLVLGLAGDDELVVAVDGDRLDALQTVVGHLEQQAATARAAPAEVAVPDALARLRSAPSRPVVGQVEPD